MHPRLSVHQICMADQGLPAFIDACAGLGVKQVSLISPPLLQAESLDGISNLLSSRKIRVQSITHVFRSGALDTVASQHTDREALDQTIDIAASLGANSVYMMTGGRGQLEWDAAAENFCAGIQPAIRHASKASIDLAIENTSSLYAELNICHNLPDTFKLAKMAGIKVCAELFFCWSEAGIHQTLAKNVDQLALVQLSDYHFGDRALPCRAPLGRGDMPLQNLINTLENSGYKGGYDLELLGPRIIAPGVERAISASSAWFDTAIAKSKNVA